LNQILKQLISNLNGKVAEMKKMMNRMSVNQPMMVVSVLFAVVMISSVYAQGQTKLTPREAAVMNLVTALNSDNEGLRKSAIYLAGKNKVKEVADVLTERLTKEKEACMKILVALSLYNIGDERGMNAVQRVAEKDSDLRVRRMCDAIFSEYLRDSQNNTARLLESF